MQKSNERQQPMRAHRQPQNSTTLNRKYVKRPTKIVTTNATTKRSPQIQHFASPTATLQRREQTQIAPAQVHPIQSAANAKMKSRLEMSPKVQSRPSARELKDQAIQKAMVAASATNTTSTSADTEKKSSKTAHHFGLGRVVLALSCAAIAVLAIVYFVNRNMPDMSFRVAALQTGIEATYPSYVPRDFNLAGIVSENGKITLSFNNPSTGDAYSLTEENSSWDSNALLNNYVKVQFGDDYAIVREQGLTIYISNNDASWVNGGIVYKLNITAGSLTKKQISSIAASL